MSRTKCPARRPPAGRPPAIRRPSVEPPATATGPTPRAYPGGRPTAAGATTAGRADRQPTEKGAP
ncbi:hypothetical protein GCM10010273_45710 [Streptomyces lavendulocolor]